MSIHTYQLLKGIGLSEQRVLRLLPDTESLTLEVGAVMWPHGAQRQPLAHIITGLVSASVPDHGTGRTPLSIYGPDTWFGETAMLNRQASTLDYVCLTPTRVLTISNGEALDAFQNEPEFARYIARLVSWRHQQHSEMLALLKIGGPQLRVVMGLALFAEAQHSGSSHTPTSSMHGSLEIPLKQLLLASMFCVSRGIISVCLRELAAAGWLRVNYATVTLTDTQTWGNFARIYRQEQGNVAKPSMPDILGWLHQAASA